MSDSKRMTEVAKLIRKLEIDIAVDLTGFTMGARTGIFALRPAPVQVNYLAYPGTMGADYIDYIVADRVVIPPEHQAWYSEKVVYLPDSYQVNDSERADCGGHADARGGGVCPNTGSCSVRSTTTTRSRRRCSMSGCGCCAKSRAASYGCSKVMTVAPRNLRREAAARGIAPERIVFAPRMKHEDHLARHRLADLFLDTLPYNAHTTASDALWAGLPVLTCLGTTFAGRVAASLLQAVGLPELITQSLGDYESLALQLANDATLLAAIKQKLARNRETFPLFDTDRFRRHIEAAYIAMWERYQRGESPSPFAIAP